MSPSGSNNSDQSGATSPSKSQDRGSSTPSSCRPTTRSFASAPSSGGPNTRSFAKQGKRQITPPAKKKASRKRTQKKVYSSSTSPSVTLQSRRRKQSPPSAHPVSVRDRPDFDNSDQYSDESYTDFGSDDDTTDDEAENMGPRATINSMKATRSGGGGRDAGRAQQQKRGPQDNHDHNNSIKRSRYVENMEEQLAALKSQNQALLNGTGGSRCHS